VISTLLILGHAEAQRVDQLDIEVDDARPVAKAIDMLVDGHRDVVINYEDPPYAYEGDIRDVTTEVRRDLDRYEPGKAPKVLVPKGGVLKATYSIASDTGVPADWGDAVQALVNAQLLTGSGGRFRVQRDATAIHVIPTQIRDATGEWKPVQSVLDAPISLQKEGNGVELLEAIAEAASQQTGQRIGVGTVPINLLMGYHGVLSASGISARDALLQLFESTGAKMRWHLFYGPDVKYYALNIGIVAPPNAESAGRQTPTLQPRDPTQPKPGETRRSN
jgi:hypothetical protein